MASNKFIEEAKKRGISTERAQQFYQTGGVIEGIGPTSGAQPNLLQRLSGLFPFLGGVAATRIPVLGQIPGMRGAIGGGGYSSGQRLQQLTMGQAPQEAFQPGFAGRGTTPEERKMIATGALLDLLITSLFPPEAKKQLHKATKYAVEKQPKVVSMKDFGEKIRALARGDVDVLRETGVGQEIETGLTKLGERAGAETARGAPGISTPQMLEERIKLSKAPIWGTTAEKAQAGRLLQRGLSEEIHGLHPLTRYPDWAYSKYAAGTDILKRLAWRILPWIGIKAM